MSDAVLIGSFLIGGAVEQKGSRFGRCEKFDRSMEIEGSDLKLKLGSDLI